MMVKTVMAFISTPIHGDVYKKENGSWNKIGNIRGPQGAAGEKATKVKR